MADTVETQPRPRRGRAAGLVVAGLVGGVVLAGLAAADAQTPTPSPSQSAPDERPGVQPFGKRGHRGMKHGLGMPGALHGEFTTRAPGGEGFQTLATQRGEATAVTATSITVRSEDGYSRTYTVNDDTLVNAGNEGIADVAVGDDVHVMAVVEGGTARAVRVMDATQVGRLHDRWMPRRPAPSPSAAT